MKQKMSQEKRITTRLTAIIMGATLMGFIPSIHVNNIDGHTQVSIQMMNSAYAKEIGNFQKPSLKGYGFNAKWNIDWDEDGRVDSTIINYKNSKGDVVARVYKIGTNKVWMTGLDSNGDNDSNILKNYNLVDTNNDGMFDTMYNMTEDIPLPKWVMK